MDVACIQLIDKSKSVIVVDLSSVKFTQTAFAGHNSCWSLNPAR